MDDLPFFAKLPQVLLAFLIALLVFHIALIAVWRLSLRTWKKVDYVWLGFGLLGVSAGVGTARRTVAANMLSLATPRLEYATKSLDTRMEVAISGGVCRTFVVSPLTDSQTIAHVQHSYDALCAWFKEAKRHVPSGSLSDRKEITLATFGSAPPSIDDAYPIRTLSDAIEEYNAAVRQFTRLSDQARTSDADELLTVIGPLLIAVAIALRVTKVTGELRQ